MLLRLPSKRLFLGRKDWARFGKVAMSTSYPRLAAKGKELGPRGYCRKYELPAFIGNFYQPIWPMLMYPYASIRRIFVSFNFETWTSKGRAGSAVAPRLQGKSKDKAAAEDVSQVSCTAMAEVRDEQNGINLYQDLPKSSKTHIYQAW